MNDKLLELRNVIAIFFSIDNTKILNLDEFWKEIPIKKYSFRGWRWRFDARLLI
jgi:hypothetical protein